MCPVPCALCPVKRVDAKPVLQEKKLTGSREVCTASHPSEAEEIRIEFQTNLGYIEVPVT